MTPDTIPQTVLFPNLADRPLVAAFDRRQASSGGGAVLLKAAERAYGLVRGLAGCLADRRDPGPVTRRCGAAEPGGMPSPATPARRPVHGSPVAE